MTKKNTLVLVKQVESMILVIRGQRIVLDADLAELYGVTTKVLNQAVKRNRDRFPKDFMFKLNNREVRNLMSQIAISSGHGGRRKLPYAFTEHGAIMAANVLNSERAIEASVYVVRAFVKLREMLASHKEMAGKLKELEKRLDSHDHDIRALVAAIRQLMEPPPKPKKEIGFRPGKD
ncbi:MAG TPA: ORF6N domain-containing protein [bacterium]|nr:ORF6N domain-containing protein [bacterium]